jgi:hypothetical protein
MTAAPATTPPATAAGPQPQPRRQPQPPRRHPAPRQPPRQPPPQPPRQPPPRHQTLSIWADAPGSDKEGDASVKADAGVEEARASIEAPASAPIAKVRSIDFLQSRYRRQFVPQEPGIGKATRVDARGVELPSQRLAPSKGVAKAGTKTATYRVIDRREPRIGRSRNIWRAGNVQTRASSNRAPAVELRAAWER